MSEAADTRKGFWAALDERFGLSELAYPVPPHANTLGYTLGGITVVGMIIMVATGILLAQWFDPMPEAANASVRFMMTEVPLARVVRGIHFWTAQAVLVTAGLHLARVFITGSYRRPREGNWLVGLGLLGLTALLYFTGTVLKYDQEGFEALAHNTGVAELLGGLGAWFSPTLARNVPMLPRLYIAHVSILPLLLFVLLGIHVLLIKKHGISPLPPEWRPGGYAAAQPHTHTFTDHLRKLLGYGLVYLGTVTVLAVVLPPAVGPSPVEGIEVSKPPWAFVWLFPLEDRWGLWPLIVVPLLLFGFLALVPFLDRSRDNSLRSRRWLLTLGGLVTAAVLVLLIMGYLAGPSEHVGM
ncbi:cytochrome b N-terminal domain-containing protein [Caldinitratiruptor microaerophilus]|uniref:Cytochrome b/b6 N-terminal region profile domain-containing protein n=1 Tax=Caldinitratiruptor microaerophilus TaxID=671077 RepID=A0AA35CP97_9FIRM|nr:cytochrome b N-terminal domain-containing protein [Caldinitratiruptor microaerophilus]BDG61151.1 hypothetical protein caldi_22410 [Caldinitratiruptor microaerophilus]